jgi:hypothetical protein
VAQAFLLCAAGTDNTCNLSVDSLTSVEAHRMLRDLPRTAADMWRSIRSRHQPATSDDMTTAAVSAPEGTVGNEGEPGLEHLLQFVASANHQNGN